MEDPRNIILKNIDLSKCRIEFSTSPIVLLCGGGVSEKLRPDDPDPEILSFRHAITRKLTPYEIFRPEEITSWQSDAVYKNLMDFEADLASICSLVVIILESAGSIAELGAFSQLEELSKKLIVVKSKDFVDDMSFINLGILRHIRRNHKTSVKTYPWKISDPKTISEEVVNDFIEDIQLELDQLTKSQVFKMENNSHIIVLISELIKHFVALKEHEIFNYLTRLGVQITKDNLRSKLFLLVNFQIIRREEYSDSTFFMYGESNYHKLRLVFRKDFHIDTLRIPVECIEFYNNSEKDRHRSRVIKKKNIGDFQ